MDEEMQQQAARNNLECIGIDFYSCEEAMKRLDEYLDHELTEGERLVVLKHLEICRPCLRRFTFEQTLVISLRQKISLLCAPPTLRAKLHILLLDEKS